MVAYDPSYFGEFEQVKNFSSHFADFEQVKITNNKTPLGETGCLCIFFWPLPHYGTSTWLFCFFECLDIQFFNSLTCDLRDTMPRQRSLTLIPRKAEDFPSGDNYSKHVPLPTYSS